MRILCSVLLLVFSLSSQADTYLQLYQTTGWPQQRANFNDALKAAQERYQSSLPPAVYQALVNNAEVRASGREQLAQHANGLPRVEADATRRLLIRHLAQALPAEEAGAEVSLALAGVAADSLSQMLPGLLGGDTAQAMLHSQRQRLMEQIGADLDNTLLHVYRELSDPELEEFVEFAQSSEGQAYYQAALAALRAGLAVGQSTSSLAPAPQGI